MSLYGRYPVLFVLQDSYVRMSEFNKFLNLVIALLTEATNHNSEAGLFILWYHGGNLQRLGDGLRHENLQNRGPVLAGRLVSRLKRVILLARSHLHDDHGKLPSEEVVARMSVEEREAHLNNGEYILSFLNQVSIRQSRLSTISVILNIEARRLW